MRPVTGVLLSFAIVLAWGTLFYQAFYQHRRAPMYDFVPTYVAAEMVGDEQLRPHIYDRDPMQFNQVARGPFTETARSIGFRGLPTPFVYPPFYAWMLVPLTATTFASAKIVVLILGALALIAGFAFSIADNRGGLKWWAIWLAAPLLLLFFNPLSYNNRLGQISTVIFGLICLSLWLARRGRATAAGILLGFCLVVKLQPLGVLIMLLALRRYRIAVVTVLTAVALYAVGVVLGGVELSREYAISVWGIASRGSHAAWNNQTIVGLLLRATNPVPEIFRWHYFRPALWMTFTQLAVAVGLFVCYLVAARRAERGGAGDYVAAFLGGILLSLVFPPIVWNHYHILAIPPALWLAASLARTVSPLVRWPGMAVLAASWVLLSLDPRVIAERALSSATGDGGAASLVCSANLMGVMLMAVLYAVVLSTHSRTRQE